MQTVFFLSLSLSRTHSNICQRFSLTESTAGMKEDDLFLANKYV